MKNQSRIYMYIYSYVFTYLKSLWPQGFVLIFLSQLKRYDNSKISLEMEASHIWRSNKWVSANMLWYNYLLDFRGFLNFNISKTEFISFPLETCMSLPSQ